MSHALEHLSIGKIKWCSMPPTVSDLKPGGRCPRCGRRNSFTGPFWCHSRLTDYFLCTCGVRYEPPRGGPVAGITDF